jgi:hypothetical protein
VTLDSQESLITYFYNRLTADATLKTAMGGTVRCYLVWAKTDAALPYLVHRVDLRRRGIWPEEMGTYTIDIWSYSTSATEIVAIRKRIIELIDQLLFNTTEVKNCYVEKQSDGFIPESTPDIWHISMLFSISLWRQQEAVYILSR